MSTDQPPTRPDRRTALNYLLAGVNSGLPVPESIGFDEDSAPTIYIRFSGGVAELDAWAAELKMDEKYRNAQPYPLDEDHQFWTASDLSAKAAWHGWTVSTKSREPITDEHRRQWVDSGRAARRAEYLAREAAKTASETASGGDQS